MTYYQIFVSWKMHRTLWTIYQKDGNIFKGCHSKDDQHAWNVVIPMVATSSI